MGVSVLFPGWPSQVVGGGGGYGQLAESRPEACQDAYSNSGPQGPAGLQARAGEEGARPGLGQEGVEAAEQAMDGWLAGQLLTWEMCPTSPGRQGLNTLPWVPTAPPTATGKMPGTTALCAWLGWVSVPFSVWGQNSLPGARESLCPWGRPWLGASLPALALSPLPPLLPGSPPLAPPQPPPFQAPPATRNRDSISVLLYNVPCTLCPGARGQTGAASVSFANPF